MLIERLGPDDLERVLAAPLLFDEPPTAEWTEMFLYELGVDDAARGQGAGKALVAALRELAEERGCYGMWVLTDADNTAAIRTDQAAGGTDPDPQVLLDWTFGA